MVMCQFLKIKSLNYTCIQSVLFYTGPFRNLDSQMVAEEITTLHKQVVQLGSVFADVFGAKRVWLKPFEKEWKSLSVTYRYCMRYAILDSPFVTGPWYFYSVFY